LIALLALLLPILQADEPRLTVEQAEKRLPRESGKIVIVEGWLTDPCKWLSCAIKTNLQDRDAPYLSLASGTPVEAELERLQGRKVKLRARLGRPSAEHKGTYMTMCTDRCDNLIPLSIEE
jgi:hypothetical protein